MSDSDGEHTAQVFNFAGDCSCGSCGVFQVILHCPHCKFCNDFVGLQPSLEVLKDFVSHVESHDGQDLSGSSLDAGEPFGEGGPVGSGNPDGETSSAQTFESAQAQNPEES